MKLFNVSLEEVQKFVAEGRLVSVERSKLLKVPNEVNSSVMDKRFYELWDIVQCAGELFNCEEIGQCLNGYDIEVKE